MALLSFSRAGFRMGGDFAGGPGVKTLRPLQGGASLIPGHVLHGTAESNNNNNKKK